MRKMLLAVILILPLLLAGLPVAQTASSQPNTIDVSFVAQTHQQTSPNCFNVQVILNVTSHLSTIFNVRMSSFYLYENNVPTITVNNAVYWSQSNNTIDEILFPENTIFLQINFANFCLISFTGLQVWLIYSNPVTPYRTRIF